MDRESAKNQQDILVQLARCIHLKRVLHCVDPDPHLNFWRLMYGGMLDLAVLEWCKVFGANGEPTHWKAVVSDTKEFREALLRYLAISMDDWAKYWNHMKRYRDEFVAHHNRFSDVKNRPDLEIALRSCYFYHDYLSETLEEPNTDPNEKLESYCKRFREQCETIAETALSATREIPECVR